MQNNSKMIKAAIGAGVALLYGFFCFITGSAKAKNKQLEKELGDAKEAQKFSRKLVNTSIDVKRQWLRDKFSGKKNG